MMRAGDCTKCGKASTLLRLNTGYGFADDLMLVDWDVELWTLRISNEHIITQADVMMTQACGPHVRLALAYSGAKSTIGLIGQD